MVPVNSSGNDLGESVLVESVCDVQREDISVVSASPATDAMSEGMPAVPVHPGFDATSEEMPIMSVTPGTDASTIARSAQPQRAKKASRRARLRVTPP